MTPASPAGSSGGDGAGKAPAFRPDPILGPILDRLGEPNTRFVFPSQIAASSALAAALARSGRRALPASRFIGWDEFKSAAFGGGPGTPATREIRSLFARSLAAENAGRPFLSAVVPAGSAASSQRWAPSIAAALPGLRSVPDGPGSILADWREIRRRYASFLDAAGLYEAAWLGRATASSGCRWLLLYPDLVEDWDEYAVAVAAMPEVETALSGSLGGRGVSAARFATAVEEIRAVLMRARDEIAAGADPAGIAISVASPESTIPLLKREAALAGIPLDIREGRPLSDGPGGRLVADIVEFARSGPSFESARRLLLDRGRPWKDGVAGRRLVDLAIRAHIVGPLPGGPDLWEAATASDEGARRLFRELRNKASRVAGAGDFARLKDGLLAFNSKFLDEGLWSPEQNAQIGRCFAALDELDEAAAIAGFKPGSMPWAADAYLDALSSARYLPATAEPGISVYRFPVAAGAYPELHFVVNLGEADARAASRPLSFLRADVREGAGAADRDLSAGLVRLLAASGRRVILSCAEDGPDGERPPHPALEPVEPHALGLGYDRARWMPDALPLTAAADAFPALAAGARAALDTVFGSGRGDWARGFPSSPRAMGPAARRAAIEALSVDGRPKLTSTAIEQYLACAFRRIYGAQLRVEAVESGLGFLDARLLGEVYHDAFRRLFRPLAASGQAILAAADRSDAAPEGAQTGAQAGSPSGSKAEPTAGRPNAAEAEAALGDALAWAGRKHGPMVEALLETAWPAMRGAFLESFSALREAIDGLCPTMVDSEELSAPLPSGDAILAGRPDLVCVRPGQRRAALVDYKKRRLPAAADLVPDSAGGVTAVQVPIYTALLKAAGYEPESAFYVSIEGDGPGRKRLLKVYGDEGAPKAAVPAESAGLLEPAAWGRASLVLDMVRSGAVFVPAPGEGRSACERCDLKSLCRVHYAVR